MKANEAPEKIYVPTAGDELHYHMTCPNNEFQESIEYTRTDVIIEKAINFFEMLGYGFTITDNITHTNYDKEQLVEDFKNYMKGE